MNRLASRPRVKRQAAAPDGSAELSIRPEQVWERPSPTQRQVVHQMLVQVGRSLYAPTRREVRDEHA
jgi:hypothetical protein